MSSADFSAPFGARVSLFKSVRKSIFIPVALVLGACGGGGGGDGGGGGTNDPDISIADASIIEGDAGTSGLQFTISLDAAGESDVTGDWVTANNGSAINPGDYFSTSGEFTIPAGQTTTSVLVNVVGDTQAENDETFLVQLSNVTNADVVDGQAVGTILDDDIGPVPPDLNIRDTSANEGDAGTTQFDFAIELSATTGSAVTGNYATRNGSASSASDYQATSGNFQIPAGQLSTTVSVDVFGDTDQEINETFFVDLTNVSNANVVDDIARGQILNDDGGSGSGSGLDERPSNTACIAPERPIPDNTVSPNVVYSATFTKAVRILQAPGDASRWYILQQDGQIRVLDVSSPSTSSVWLDFTSNVNSNFEGGLLGMAFDPDYPSTPEIYVYYTSGTPMTSRLSRVTLTLDGNGDPTASSEEILLTVPQPADNHNGGEIAFGPAEPERYLYLALGDGGGVNYVVQDDTELLGNMLRIDVLDRTSGYAIPSTNPNFGNALCSDGDGSSACPEIYAMGLRNPYRWSFDYQTGVLWVADVGANSYEEIDHVELGGNYGWDCREGANDFPFPKATNCSSGTFTDPVYDYPHANGNESVTGGFVYRGTALPGLVGRYIFGDYASGRIWALQSDGGGGFTAEEIYDGSDLGFGLTNFAVGEDGEIYLAEYTFGVGGQIRRLAPSGSGTNTIPDDLDETGCLDTDSLVAYAIQAPFWSDGAVKTRYMGLPNSGDIDPNENSGDDWDFPNGTVLVKNFDLDGRMIETRLFMKHPDGVWAGYTYEWNAAETAATRVIGGKTTNIDGQDWIYPSEAQCLECHTAAAGFSLGLETAQLNGDFQYEITGRTANQLETLETIGMFTPNLVDEPAAQPQLANPDDTSASLDDRARAYLHSNCANCHQPGGTARATMDLRYTTTLGNTNACNVAPGLGDLGVPNALLIAPGEPDRSLVLNRMDRRDASGMPPIGSNEVNDTGVDLIRAWITSLGGC